jgi:hemoglobin-like flavoprotein
MSKTVDNYYILYNNPFLLSEILIEFYRNYQNSQDRDVLLSYLVLPITLYEKSNESLQHANSKRTIRTFAKEIDRLYGLEQRLSEFKKLTDHCLQLLIDQKMIAIEEHLQVKVTELGRDIKKNQAIASYTNAAINLAKMFNGVELVSIYRQLGIKQI